MTYRATEGWDSTIYRDELDEASVETVWIGFDELLADARQRVASAIAARGWAMWSATIDQGDMVERLVPGDGVWRRERFDWSGHRWYSGPTWDEEEGARA